MFVNTEKDVTFALSFSNHTTDEKDNHSSDNHAAGASRSYARTNRWRAETAARRMARRRVESLSRPDG